MRGTAGQRGVGGLRGAVAITQQPAETPPPSRGATPPLMAIKHQTSPEIQDFLVYWLLEQVSAEGMPPGQLGVEAVRRSGGDLRPAESDVRAAQVTCWQRGWLNAPHPFSLQAASLSAGGRVELNRRAAATTAGRAEVAGDPREKAAERLLALISPAGKHEVLDVGTGGGFLARKLAAAGFRVLGIDVDADAIAGATKEPAPGDRLRFEVADIHGLAEGKRRWLTIVTSYLLHECDDPIATLRSICACLGPGGRLACMDFPPNCAAYLSGVGRTPFHAFRALAKGDWQALASELGLSLSEQLCFGYVSVTLARKEPDEDGRTPITQRIGESIP